MLLLHLDLVLYKSCQFGIGYILLSHCERLTISREYSVHGNRLILGFDYIISVTYNDQMNSLAQTLNLITQTAIMHLPIVLKVLLALWGIQLINAIVGYRLNYLGLVPRTVTGLLGIFISPFLHAGFDHLFVNSVVLFVLMNLMLLFGIHTWLLATFLITVISGGLVWLLGRRAIHIGASGVIMGYWGFLLVSAYSMGSLFSILIAAICLYFFSSLILNVLPLDRRSSWEGHLFGLIAGITTVYLIPLFQ